jgi:ATPase subunit of ABC transporter with duplicated ATPase domains
MEKADSGEVKVGETVKISYVDQSRSVIDPKKSLWEVVSDGLDFIKVGNVEMPSRAYVSALVLKDLINKNQQECYQEESEID